MNPANRTDGAVPLSPRNSEIARLRSLARNRRARSEAGRFVVEGVKLVGEVLESELEVIDVYADAAWVPPSRWEDALARRALDIVALSARAVERIASTTSPQPVVAEVELPLWEWDLVRPEASVLVLVDLNDPGNVGTLVRSAAAAGFDAVVALGDTADPFGPKVVRASAGALFRLPSIVDRDVDRGLAILAERGARRLGTRMADATACDQVDLQGPVAIVLGSEAHGLGGSHDGSIDEWVRVPMHGDVESLNVAMAGTILTYEVARQRRAASCADQ